MSEAAEIWVYESRRNVHIFLKSHDAPGGFIQSVQFSNSVYLETGAFSDQMYLASKCHKALPEEVEQYKNILRNSKRGKLLIEQKLI